jgi:hypothetical protein
VIATVSPHVSACTRPVEVERRAAQGENVSVGLLDYPVLMAVRSLCHNRSPQDDITVTPAPLTLSPRRTRRTSSCTIRTWFPSGRTSGST